MSEDTPCLIDSLGRQVQPHKGPARIISMTGPLTDLMLALGLEDQIVGHATRPTRIIDSRDIGTVEMPDMARILNLEPTHVLINPNRTPQAVQDQLADKGLTVIAMAPATVEDNFHLFCFFGSLFDAKDAADTLSRRFEAGLARVKMALRKSTVKRILYIAGSLPLRTVATDSYAASLFAIIRLLPVMPPHEGVNLDDSLDSLLLSADKVVFNGAPGLFRSSDIARFAKVHDIPANRLHRLDMDPAQQIGVRAIETLETLPALRKTIDHSG